MGSRAVAVRAWLGQTLTHLALSRPCAGSHASLWPEPLGPSAVGAAPGGVFLRGAFFCLSEPFCSFKAQLEGHLLLGNIKFPPSLMLNLLGAHSSKHLLQLVGGHMTQVPPIRPAH